MLDTKEVADGDTFGALVPSHAARGQPQWQSCLGHCLQASSYSMCIPEVSGVGMLKVVWRMLYKNEVADGETFGVLGP